MSKVVYDSMEREDIDSRGFEPELSLEPYTRYYWQVYVTGDKDSGVSEVHYFETGKLSESWSGHWITPSFEDKEVNPYIRKTFNIDGEIESARAYIIGLGLYELEINGLRVGNERLTPYCNAYDAWLQYQTFDITTLLKTGDNAAGVLLGNGWAKGPFGTFGDLNTPYIHEFALLCELRVTYKNGTVQWVTTDDTWKCHRTPIINDSMYDGETYDASLELSGWSMADYHDAGWEQTVLYEPKGLGPVVDRMSPPVIIKETLKPAGLIITPKNEQVLDMGQNMVGWLRFRVNEPKGTVIKISHGEVLQDDCFYRDNLRTAKQEYVYISNGMEAVVEPHFTFYGFRYAKLEGFTNEINMEDFTGCVVYSDLQEIGHIETSDPLVNRLFTNALWGQKGNFLDVPTDCPQRDERMGWTGDAQVFSGTASFNMDTYAFYAKFLRDLYEEQRFSGGMVASTVPTFTQKKHLESGFIGGGACGWSDAATIIPWEVYLHTGDVTILKRQYQSMKDWVDWIIRQDQASGDRRLWTTGFHFGDWLALDGPVVGGVMGGTDNGLLASAFYRYSTRILSKAAGVLNKKEDETYYGRLSEEIKQAVQNEYFTKNGRSAVGTQTAHVAALYFNLVEEKVKDRVLKDLREILKKSHMHLKTGFLGTPYLCRALSDQGDSETAYQIFFQEDYPSWLYEVNMGATTIWERWNSILPDGKISGTSMNSLNHYAYGSIVEWMYRNMCGLKPLEEAPGFKKFIIKPSIHSKLMYAHASVYSAMGLIKSGWERIKDNEILIKVEVPFNTQAAIILPDTVLSCVEGIQGLKAEQIKEDVYIHVSSGRYEFSYLSAKPLKIEYSIDTPIWELKQNKQTYEILNHFLPHIATADTQAGGMELPYSLGEVVKSGDPFKVGMILKGADIEAMNQELMKVPYSLRTLNTANMNNEVK